MHQRLFRALLFTLPIVLVPLVGRAAPTVDQYCTINTGLDPACPITAVGVSSATSVLTSTATLHTDTIFGSVEWRGNEQLTVSLPLYQHLGITGVGDAFGTGDISVGYTRAFGSRKRLTQVAALSATIASGGEAFNSTGRSQIAPLYAMSYALGNRISLVVIGQYSFDAGGTKMPFTPRIQTLNIIPRAIIDLSKTGIYCAADVNGANVTGYERYQAYQADATLGVAHGHNNLSLTYSVPIARFTRQYVFYRAIGFQYSWRR